MAIYVVILSKIKMIKTMSKTIFSFLLLPLLLIVSPLGDTVPEENVRLTLKRGSGLTPPPTIVIKGEYMLIRYVSNVETTFTISSKLFGEIEHDVINTDGSYYIFDMSVLNYGVYTIDIENVNVAYSGTLVRQTN